MKVYRIWNVTRQTWYKSGRKISIWTTLSGVKNALRYVIKYAKLSRFEPDYFIIYEFELANKKEFK